MYYLDSSHYFDMVGYGSYEWQWVRGEFIVFTSPVWIYWIVIPFIKIMFNWIKEGK